MTDDDIIDVVLGFEGGFVDNPADHGGPTNFGITAARLGRSLGLNGPATRDQVRSLTRDQAIVIYKKDYIAGPGFGDLEPDSLKLVLVDSGVLFGPVRSVKWVQQALRVTPDGVLGQATKSALQGVADRSRLARQVLGVRFESIADIVANDRSQTVFLRGWISRAVELLDRV